jgi:hypothetical protein
VERQHSSHLHKRKERGESEERGDGVEKKAMVLEGRMVLARPRRS